LDLQQPIPIVHLGQIGVFSMRYIGIPRPDQIGILPDFASLTDKFGSVKIVSRGTIYLLEAATAEIEEVRAAVYPYYLIIEDFDPPKENAHVQESN
jgi:hypothetical protein